MIIGGYQLDLYCDCDFCLNWKGSPATEQYGGRNETEAYRTAKKAGWEINKSKGRCIAPNVTHAEQFRDVWDDR